MVKKIQRPSLPQWFFSKKEKKALVEAIAQAEKETSGEIRIHLTSSLKGPLLEEAQKVFHELKMTRTKKRNGVLILLCIRNQSFVILGDEGINGVVGKGFWDEIVASVSSHFKEDRFAEGLSIGIALIGQKLKTFFPGVQDDINELPDEISYSH